MEIRSLGAPRSSITSTSQSYQEIDDDSSTIRPKKGSPNFSRKIRIGNTDNEQGFIEGFGFTFDPVLKSSRVYKRVLSRQSVISCSSSVVPSMGWSFLSGLSLANISNISLLSLPISPNELWNSQYYGFDTDFQSHGPELEEASPSPAPTEHSSEAGFAQLVKPYLQWNRRNSLVALAQQEVSLRN